MQARTAEHSAEVLPFSEESGICIQPSVITSLMAYCTLPLVSTLVVVLFTVSAVAGPSRQVRRADGPQDTNWRVVTASKAIYEVIYEVSQPRSHFNLHQ